MGATEGLPDMEERKEIIKNILKHQDSLNVFDVMHKLKWSKSCAYNTLNAMKLSRETFNRTHYFSLPDGNNETSIDTAVPDIDDRANMILKALKVKPMTGSELSDRFGWSKTCIYGTLKHAKFDRYKEGCCWFYLPRIMGAVDKKNNKFNVIKAFYKNTQRRYKVWA